MKSKKTKAKTVKIISASGKTYYKQIKASKSKPAKKLPAVKVVKKVKLKKSKKANKTISSNPFSITNRFNWKSFERQYNSLFKIIQKDEKELQKKKAVLKMIGDHLISIEREFSPM